MQLPAFSRGVYSVIVTSLLLTGVSAQVVDHKPIECGTSGEPNIRKSDINAMIYWLDKGEIDGWSNPIDMRPASIFREFPNAEFKLLETVAVELQSNYIWPNSPLVAFSTIARALEQMRDTCCGDAEMCKRHEAYIHAEDGKSDIKLMVSFHDPEYVYEKGETRSDYDL